MLNYSVAELRVNIKLYYIQGQDPRKLVIMLQKYNRLILYTTPPYTKRQKCIAKQQYILLKQL